MSSPTLDRDVAEAIYRLVGQSETGLHFTPKGNLCECSEGGVPAYGFSETIRLLPKIAEKARWCDLSLDIDWMRLHAQRITRTFMHASTAEDGMVRVSEYLRNIL